jgi:hypothetical protein
MIVSLFMRGIGRPGLVFVSMDGNDDYYVKVGDYSVLTPSEKSIATYQPINFTLSNFATQL